MIPYFVLVSAKLPKLLSLYIYTRFSNHNVPINKMLIIIVLLLQK